MKDTDQILQLIEEIKGLKVTISDLGKEVKLLKSVATERNKIPGIFTPGDSVIILTDGLIGKPETKLE